MKSIFTIVGGGAGLVRRARARPSARTAVRPRGACRAVEQQLAAQSAPSAREIQSRWTPTSPRRRPTRRWSAARGSAGYDGGFWIRGGSFLLKINLTLQTRYEYFDWDDNGDRAQPGRRPLGLLAPARDAEVLGRRDLRHPLLRRARVRPRRLVFDNVDGDRARSPATLHGDLGTARAASSRRDGADYGIAREAWIEYEAAPAARVPHGSRQDGGHPPADDAPRDAAVRRHLAGVGLHRHDDARLHRPQP